MEVIKINNKSVYFELHNDLGTVTDLIEYPLYKCTEGERSWFLLYNDAMEMNYKFYKYINRRLVDADIKTRTNQARDLRLFFVFLKATGLSVDHLLTDDIFALIDFLAGKYIKFGIAVKNNAGERVPASKNTRSTVINRISTIRKFLKYNRITCEALAHENSVVIHNYINDTLEGHIDHGRNLNFVNANEYQKLLEVIAAANDESAFLKVELIYQYTLQNHEVNKITVEDLHNEDNEYYLVIPYISHNKGIVLTEGFYHRLEAYLIENGTLYEKSFPAWLYEYYSIAIPDQEKTGGSDVCSMLRKGCIFRIIFEHGGNIETRQLASILQVQNASYLKYYIEEAKKELSGESRSN